jgi:hypothetical protein
VTDLSPEQVVRARRLNSAVRREIVAVATQFALPTQEQDGRGETAAPLIQSGERLEDSRSMKLRGYGPVDPALGDSLDPQIAALIALVLGLE